MTGPASGASTARPLRLMLRLDATATTGLGHGVRTAGIVAALEEPLDLIVVGEGEALTSLFPGASFIDRTVTGPELAALARASNVDCVIVDLPSYAIGKWDAENFGEIPLGIIDDWGGPLKASLIINGTVLDEYHRYPAMADPSRVLTGPRYSLIRPVFGKTPWCDPDSTDIVLVAGSGARAGAWAMMVTGPQTDRSQWGKLTVIVGTTFAALDPLRRRCAEIGATLHVGVSGETLASRLAAARVALITGGMIVYEALAVGVPSVVFPQLENCSPEAAWFANGGCILDLGFDGGMEATHVSRTVTRLLGDAALAKDMSMRGRRIIDGQGTARAAAAIVNLIGTRIGSRT